MRFIGDVHGKVDEYKKIIDSSSESSIQIGDMGVGFPNIYLPELDATKHKFIRGNHDSPEAAKNYPSYLGDWGYLEAQGIFYLGGAWSIDYQYRVPGISWWADEELSYDELNKAAEKFYEVKPKIMVTHEAPTFVATEIMLRDTMNNKTSLHLWKMWDGHKPDLWIFGHWHKNWCKKIKGTEFVCVDELCTFSVPGIEF